MGTQTAGGLPDQFTPRRLVRGALEIAALIGVLVLVAVLAPGLGEVRDALGDVKPGWIALGVVFEALSCASYVLMFRPVFCRRMPWRTARRSGWPRSGSARSSRPAARAASRSAPGCSSRDGMPADRIARRSVAFFLIKSSVNFVAVAVIGTPWRSACSVRTSSLLADRAARGAGARGRAIAIVLLPQFGPGDEAPRGAGRVRRLVVGARTRVVDGTAEAIEIVRRARPARARRRDRLLGLGQRGAVGDLPCVRRHARSSIVLMGYLIGQLGGLLPLPGGVGGIDGGLIGTLVVYGAPAAATAAAVLAYRLILFWVPLLLGAVAFWTLRRRLARTG